MEFILDWGEITYINKVPHGGQLKPQRAPLRPLDGHMRPKGVDMGSLGGNLGRQGGDIGPLKMTWGLRRWEGVSGRSLGALGRSLGTSGRSYRPSGKSLLSCKDVHWLPGKSIGGHLMEMTQNAGEKPILVFQISFIHVFCNISASSGPISKFFFSNSIYIEFPKQPRKPYLSMTLHLNAIACIRYLLTRGLHKKQLKSGCSDLQV